MKPKNSIMLLLLLSLVSLACPAGAVESGKATAAAKKWFATMPAKKMLKEIRAAIADGL